MIIITYLPLKTIIVTYLPLKTIIITYLPLKTIIVTYLPLKTIIITYLPLKTIIITYLPLTTIIITYLPLKTIIITYLPLKTIIITYLPLKTIISILNRIDRFTISVRSSRNLDHLIDMVNKQILCLPTWLKLNKRGNKCDKSNSTAGAVQVEANLQEQLIDNLHFTKLK